jgi:hypothetical protein
MHRCDRNRKRSKRRGIFCPIHGCHIDSVSRKHSLYADKEEQLCDRGISHSRSRVLLSNHTTVALTGEWLEEFWCSGCQGRTWYHVHLTDHIYKVSVAPQELWRQASGVIDPIGNTSVGEFTRDSAKRNDYECGGVKSIRWAG